MAAPCRRAARRAAGSSSSDGPREPPSPMSSRAMTSKPCFSPSSRSVPTSPELRTPKRVSLPTTTATAPRASTKVPLDELLRGLLGELAGEVEHERRTETDRVECLEALLERHDCGRRAVGVEHGDGMRLEGHCHWRRAAVPGLADDARQDLAVPAVHAVEVAEGDDRGPEVGRDVVESVPAMHGDHCSGRASARSSRALGDTGSRSPGRGEDHARSAPRPASRRARRRAGRPGRSPRRSRRGRQRWRCAGRGRAAGLLDRDLVDGQLRPSPPPPGAGC